MSCYDRSLLPFRLEDAEVAIYAQRPDDCSGSSSFALFEGCCSVSLGVESDYGIEARGSSGGLLTRHRRTQERHTVSIDRVHVQRAAAGTPATAYQRAGDSSRVEREFLVVVVWQDPDTLRWEKRTYPFAVLASDKLAHDSGTLQDGSVFYSSTVSADGGAAADYSLQPALFAEVWHVSAAGAESLCYDFEMIESAWRQLVPTSEISAKIGMDILTGPPQLSIAGTEVLAYESGGLNFLTGGGLSDTGPAAGVGLNRAEFRIFGRPVCAISVLGDVFANGFEEVAGLGGGPGDYVGEAFAFGWNNVRFTIAGVLRAPSFSFTL